MRIIIHQSIFLSLLTLFFGILMPKSLIAQSSSQTAKLESVAKKHYKNSQYHLALEAYLKLDSISPNNPKYLFPIGVCYLNSSYEENHALKYLEKCLKQPDKYPPSLNFYAGKAYHLSHKMDEAIQQFEIYNTYLKKDEKKNQKTISNIIHEIEMCQNGKEFISKPLNVDILNLGPKVNSIYPDYAAVLSADLQELIFTSCRPNTTGGLKDPNDGYFHEDLYISFNSDSGWSEPKNMGDSVNTEGNDASIALSADGQTLFLYKSVHDPDNQNMPFSGDIYVSKLNGKVWTAAAPLPSSINSKNYELGASISADGNSLFYSSNRAGGYGGMDLYMVKKLPNGEWAVPMNLGNKINTSYDEDSPFIHSDGKTLYFSSTGHKTMGGYDIFSTVFDEEKNEWSTPQNFGYPISTAHDDIHFTWSPNGKKIYFSSRREDSYGDQDIYYAILHQDKSTEVLVMKGYILDSLNSKPVLGKITVINNKNNEVVGIFDSNSETGKYLIVLPEGHYKMKIESDKHHICEQTIDILELKGFEEIDKNITLCPNIPPSK